MLKEFFQPIDESIIQELKKINKNCIGNVIIKHTDDEFPVFEKVDVAIIGVLDQRGLGFEKSLDLTDLRKTFYKLYKGNWDLNIIDLGDIKPGETQNDTYFVIQQIAYTLQQHNIKGIFMSGSQDMTFPIYSAYQLKNKLVNLVNIDYSFDIDNYDEVLTANTFVSKMIIQDPLVLNDYNVIGHQSYFVSQESLDLMNAMFFSTIRLGEISNNTILAEPILRYSEIVSVDMHAIETSYSGNFNHFTPNGLTGKEICALMRYAGLGLKQEFLGLFNHGASKSESKLISQMIWYYLDGVQNKYFETPEENPENFTKYNVPIDDENFVFYKSKRTERMWIELKFLKNMHNNKNKSTLFPCSEADYLKACNQELPDIWLKNQRKLMS